MRDVVAEQPAKLGDALLQVGVLVLDTLALEPGERAEPQVEDRLRLDLGQLEALHERRRVPPRCRRRRGSAR